MDIWSLSTLRQCVFLTLTNTTWQLHCTPDFLLGIFYTSAARRTSRLVGFQVVALLRCRMLLLATSWDARAASYQFLHI